MFSNVIIKYINILIVLFLYKRNFNCLMLISSVCFQHILFSTFQLSIQNQTHTYTNKPYCMEENVFNSITIRLYICSYHKKSPMSNRMKTILGGGLFSPDVQKVYEEREKK